MLLLEVTNKPIAEIMKVEEDFAGQLIRDEGEAILMWAIEGAMLDYADTDRRIFNTAKQAMVEAAYAYTRETSLYWQWVEARMRLGPKEGPEAVNIDLLEGFEMFKDYVWTSIRERTRDRRSDFKAALTAMLGERIEITRRTKGQHKGRYFIKGLGLAQAVEAPGDVIDINSARRPAADTAPSKEAGLTSED
jgi:hypothetical protein